MKREPWPPPDTFKDGRQFLAWQSGELFVARFDQSTIPPALTFRYHRNRVDRHYRFVSLDFGMIGFDMQIPIDKPWPETWESVWVRKLTNFTFNPQQWAAYNE